VSVAKCKLLVTRSRLYDCIGRNSSPICRLESRASAAALSTVLRTTILSLETYDFRVPAKRKPLNRSKRNFQRWITSVVLPAVPKMVGIGRLGKL
jgi:hypothetical protein